MHHDTVLVVLLGLVGVLQGVPIFSKENFYLDMFMGTWYDVAVASNCSLIKQITGDVPISVLELRMADVPDIVRTNRKIWRKGKCKQISGEYDLSDTPGRFTYHVPKWGADVEVNLIQTDYVKYAIVLHSSTERTTGKQVSTLKLYSRTVQVAHTLTEEFYRLLRKLDMDVAMVIIKKDKGQCLPGMFSESKPEKSSKEKPTKPAGCKPKKSSKEKSKKSAKCKSKKSSKEKSKKSAECKSKKSSKEKSKKSAECKSKKSSKEKSKKSAECKSKKSSKEKSKKSAECKSKKSSKEKSKKSAECKSKKSSKEKSTKSAECKSKKSSKEKSTKSAEQKSENSSKEKSTKSAEQKSEKSSKEKSTKSAEQKSEKSSKEKSTKSAEQKSEKSSKEKSTKSAELKPDKSAKEKSSENNLGTELEEDEPGKAAEC